MTVQPDGAAGTSEPLLSQTTTCASKVSPDWTPAGNPIVRVVTGERESASGPAATKVIDAAARVGTTSAITTATSETMNDLKVKDSPPRQAAISTKCSGSYTSRHQQIVNPHPDSGRRDDNL